MSNYLKQVESFIGNGCKNEAGETLYQFLNKYDASKYKNPCVTADILVFHEDEKSISNIGLKILLIKRKNHPCIGEWALPGGFVEFEEELETAAKRELEEETGVTNISLEKCNIWGNVDRDPRTRIISVSYLAYLNHSIEVKAGDDAKEAAWMDISIEKIKKYKSNNSDLCTQYSILLEDTMHKLSAIVEVQVNPISKLKNNNYEIIEQNGIAFDHAKIILDALLKLKTANVITI